MVSRPAEEDLEALMEALSPSVKLVIDGSPFIIAFDIAVVVGVPSLFSLVFPILVIGWW